MIREKINETLTELLQSQDGILLESASYSLEGGKRLRPLLTLAVTESHSVPIEKVLQPACAIEMVHTYSLIHDDLPCMDDDDFRRGKPTSHKVFSESHAVLTGDFLLTFAFEILANAPHLTDREKNQLISILALRGGSYGMIGGQILDMQKATDPIEMYRKKTAALVSASLEFGAILSGAHLPPYQAIGEHLGLAYQIVDDLIDEDGVSVFYGRNEAEKMAEKHYGQALKIIENLEKPAPLLLQLADQMVHRTV